MTKYAICPTCEGEGTVVNPSIDAHGIPAAEMDELGDEFREDYRAGLYDVRCPECEGNRVVPACGLCSKPAVANVKGYGDRRESVGSEHFRHCDDHMTVAEQEQVNDLTEMYAAMAAERRMGA